MTRRKKTEQEHTAEIFASFHEAAKRIEEIARSGAWDAKPRLRKVTEFVGEARGEQDSHFFWFDTLTSEQRGEMWVRARETGERPADDGYLYGSALLSEVEPGKRGRWRITVEFEPEEER